MRVEEVVEVEVVRVEVEVALWYKSNYVGELKALGFGAEGS